MKRVQVERKKTKKAKESRKGTKRVQVKTD